MKINWRFDLAGKTYWWWPRWAATIYDWASDEVTGHSVHALNGLIPCAILALPALFWGPLTYYLVVGILYTGAVIFYSRRESDGGEWTADNIGDVIWVYALWLTLLLPWWWVAPLLGVPCLAYDVWYWFSRAPDPWMDMAVWPWSQEE